MIDAGYINYLYQRSKNKKMTTEVSLGTTTKKKAVQKKILKREIEMSKKAMSHFDFLSKSYSDLADRYAELWKMEKEILTDKQKLYNQD